MLDYSPGKIEEAVSEIQKEARSRVDRLGADYRLHVLLPFCAKHRLDYDCGNLAVYFTDEKDVSFTGMRGVMEDERFSSADREDFSNIFGALDKPTFENSFFGCHVASITTRDWQNFARAEAKKYTVEISNDVSAFGDGDGGDVKDLEIFVRNLAMYLEMDFRYKVKIQVKPVKSLVSTYKTTGPKEDVALKISNRAREMCSDDSWMEVLLDPEVPA